MHLINTSTIESVRVNELVNLACGNIPFDSVVVKVKKTKGNIGYSGRAYRCLPYRDCYIGFRKKGLNKLVTVNLNDKVSLPLTNLMGKWKTLRAPKDDNILRELKTTHKEVFEGSISFINNKAVCNYKYRDGLPYGGKDSIQITYNSYEEVLIGIMAHEACHIYQFQNNLVTSEAQCEWFAASQLELYRNGEFEKMKKSLPFDV